MRGLSVALLAALFAVAGVLLYLTSDGLPAQVASHFDAAGHANGYMPRSSYLLFMALVTFGVPLLIVEVTIVLPRFVPRLVRIPARDYWLAQERRTETLASIATSGVLTACLLTGFMIGVHLLVVEANKRAPPKIDSELLWVLIILLAVGILAWQLFRWRRFRRPD
jgi:uncharacterized membrane protein